MSKISLHRSPVHKAKFGKNVAVILALLAFIALIWVITMIKIKGA